MSINPKRAIGNWDEGWTLDKHVISSVAIGENAWGHMEFDTTRTELGEQVFLLKNRNRISAIENIMELISPFLDDWKVIDDVDVVMPAPPTKKNRLYQPAFEIAYAIAEYTRKSYVDDVLEKTSDVQSKNLDRFSKVGLKGSIVATRPAKHKHNILLVDDLMGSGSTLNECVSVLREDENIDKIYVLVMTRTGR